MSRIGKGKRKESIKKKRKKEEEERQCRRKNMKFSFSGAQRVVDEKKRKREKEREKNRGNNAAQFLFEPLSLVARFVGLATLFLFAVDASAWNSSLHEWTSTPPSLIKLSGYRASGTQLVFSTPPRSWYLGYLLFSKDPWIRLESETAREEIFSVEYFSDAGIGHRGIIISFNNIEIKRGIG